MTKKISNQEKEKTAFLMAIEVIMDMEGFRDNIYHCPGGYKTIGYGHLVKEGESFSVPLSKQEGLKLLENDLREVVKQVKKVITNSNIYNKLTDYQLTALYDFVYNIGANNFYKSTLLKKLNAGEPDAIVAEEFMKWVWSNGKKLNGLIMRRAGEKELFLMNTKSSRLNTKNG